MSLLQQQNFLARLYTDENIRNRFLSEPEKIGNENDLTEQESAELARIIPAELNFFADSLFWKRLRETEKFLPLTKKVLKEKFVGLFREFSQIYNPKSVKKHLEDAIEFCRFLQGSAIEPAFIKDIAKYEQGKLEFFGLGKLFVCKKLDYDIREISDQTVVSDLKKKLTFAVWLKIGGKIKHFLI